MNISFLEFCNAQPDSLTWYDLLPGDDVFISEIPTGRNNTELVHQLLSSNANFSQSDIDLLAARLLNQDVNLSESSEWHALSHRMSALMSANLTVEGSRLIRMRAQRLNYYIQSLTSSSANCSNEQIVVREQTLFGNKPWDHIYCKGAQWWISSDKENIHFMLPNGSPSHRSAGLPTQLDMLPDGRLSVGSIYSTGAWLIDGDDWIHVAHDCPIVLVFVHKEEMFFLDHEGNIFLYESRALVANVACMQVHFARYFGGALYCMDNSNFGHITCYDLDSGRIDRFSTLPVMVCNDIVAVGENFYLVDKQQGSVFKFDRKWKFVSRVLRFGKEEGCLFDPVGIRYQEGRLQVVSWLSSRLTTLKLF